jgi:hypothetical protein
MQGRKRSSRVLRLLAVVLLALAVQVGGIFLWFSIGQATAQQPVAFDHEAMIKAGITCLFCHADATRSPAAGMPSVESCMGCHEVIATDKPGIQAVADYWQRGEPIPWVRVNRLPRFVYFSHRVHVVAAGLNCERCHGDVAHMTVAEPVANMNMGWCLGCHQQQPNHAQLRDCVVCHQ